MDASQPTLLYGYYAEEGEEEYWVKGVDLFDKVEIDGTEVSITDLDSASGAYQLSVGEHTVAYTLKDPTIIGAVLIDESTMTHKVGAVFIECISITSVTIPNSVTSIGSNAFQGCSGLASVTIGDSVTNIDMGAFWSCTSLTSIGTVGSGASVEIPNSVTSIGDSAFRSCSGLTSVIIPNSVTSIGAVAFRSCSGLTSVTIGNGVTSIGDGAFRDCTSLTSVTIPDSVTSIGQEAFVNCSGLTRVEIDSNTIMSRTYTSKENLKNAFGGQVTEYIIGNSVTSIGEHAFYGCSGLASVTIGDSVTSIGRSAFQYCSKLTSVTIGSGVTSISNYAFCGCPLDAISKTAIEAINPDATICQGGGLA